MVICIAPGFKGSSPIYDDLKYFLTTECPVPSQVILSGTIKRAKNLRNILKNLMIQISAKIGDIPWGYKDLPLMNVPTMIIGMDVCHKVGKNKRSVIAFVASLNKYVGQYYTGSATKGEDQAMSFKINQLFHEAFTQFIQHNNGKAPQQIIVYRDAVSDGQAEVTMQTEIPQLLKTIQNLIDSEIMEKPSILFLLANKKIEQRFYTHIINKQGKDK